MTDIHARLSELTPAQRKLLALKLKQKAAGAGDTPAADAPREYPASFAQRRLWLLDRLQPGSHAYNIPGGWRFGGPFDADAMARTLSELARRHEALRTRLETRGDEPVQVVLPPAPVPLPLTDLSARPADEREPELERLARENAERPFRLDEAPLFRAALVRMADDDHALLWTVHHAVSDGWSSGVLARELFALYGAFAAGLPSPLPPPGVPYGEYAARQRERLSGAALERLTGFWRDALAGAPARLELPTDFPRPAARSPHGGMVEAALGADVPARVEALARAEGATPFMVYLAAFQLLLGRWAQQRDVLVGTAIANRATPEVEDTVGFFVNTLVLRGDLGGEPSFRALVGRVRGVTLAAYDHQELPFEKLVEEINPERSLSYAPLVQAMFVLHNQGAPAAASAPTSADAAAEGGLRVAPVGHGAASTRFDLSLSVVERGGGAEAWLTWATDLWEHATAARMLERYGALLAAALDEPDAPAWALPMFVAGERERLAGEWAGTPRPFPRGTPFPARFAEQARRTPGAVAVESPTGTLTFAQLDDAAGRLARWLRARGAGPEVRVGVCLGHTGELVVAILAVLRSGAAWVPLDPAHPRERLAGVMNDAGVSIVLTTSELLGRAPDDPRVVALDAIEGELQAPFVEDGEVEADPSQLAYVLYTSGSTGRPKGVMVEHGSLASYLEWVDAELFSDRVEAVAMVTRPGFDAVLKQLFSPLLRGLAVWIPGEDTAADPAALMAALAGRRGTAISCVPALWSALLDAADQGRAPLPAPHTLQALWLGGERLHAALVSRTRARLPHVRIVNVYGPTEVTANATFADADAGALVPIGRPVTGDAAYVVDEALRLLPGDLSGELMVGGAGVSRGYLGAPALTAERFIPDPFSAVPGARLYRTGDRARRWADGRLEYLGRLDDQVKVRGVRIEPGEVEAALRALPGVRDAAVAAVDGGPGGTRLAAYVVAPGAEPEALRAALAARLPEVMVPTAFVMLDALPRTPHGKVDRRALPAPELAADEGDWVEPATATERRVAEIWAEVIGVERVGSRDDFFLLGGHSLLATQVISRVREAFSVELPLRALFEAARLSAFAAMVDAAMSDDAETDAPVTARGGNDLPLSFAQERLWFVDRLDPGNTTYNVPAPMRLAGPLDVRALQRALGEMVRRHEVLRTRFALVDGAPVQRIEPAEGWSLPVDDISTRAEDDREAQIRALAAAEGRVPFDLEAGPLFRARLVRAGDDDHLLLMGMHHAISDGWSTGIFWRELATLYGAFSRGEASPLPEIPVRYADFAAWQREWLRGARLAAQVAWWREHLAGAPAVLTLPTDRPRPPAQSHRGARIGVSLPADAAGALRALALEQRATPFMALLAAFGLVLSRWSGQSDVVVGTPVAGRTRRETEGVIGLFVNTLPIRADLGGDPTFRELLGRVREATLGAYAHQDLPFERLVEELAPERSLSHSPVFQVMLTLQNAPQGASEGFAGVEVHGAESDMPIAKADVSLVLMELPDGRFVGALEYATDLFDAGTAHRLAEHLAALVRAAVEAPDAPVSTLSLIGGEERAALVAAGSAAASFEVTRSLPARFAEQAARTPGAVALTFGGESVAYAELDARANRLAHRLIALGARADSLVGLFVDRSAETVAGILAILKAGAAYLPLDPAYPEDRLAYMLEDSRARIVVSTAALRGRLPEGTTILCLQCDAEAIAAEPSGAPAIGISPESLAYVIYTSGSTGKPKGVQVTHANVARLFAATDAWFGFGTGDVWTLFHSFAFDFSVWEIWGALLYGGRLVVVPFDVSRSPEEFYALLEAEGVTVLNQTPSAFRQLMRADEEAAERGEMRELALRHVIFGGEALEPATLRGWVERRGDDRPRLVNMYGITETTVHVTWRVIRAADTAEGAASPIGVAIPDLAIHLLDRGGRLVPAGIAGEMYVGGAGVARGYLHRPGLTAERFVPDPFSAHPGARLYRSGDLARRLPDGSLQFHGRADDQVKVRGFRIEPGEIEAVLLAHPQVREAVVLPRGEGEERRLVAWIVAEGVDAAALRAHLSAHLPDYMVPSAFVPVDALPLTRHGKVDRAALPEPAGDGLAGAGWVAPRTPTEELLAAVWAELLGAARVGVDDGFFELGGHSLMATRVASRVREMLGVELPVRAVFEHPTLGGLAAEVDRLRRTAQGLEAPPIRPVPRDGGYLPLSFAQERLWFVDRMEAGSATYHMPMFARLEGELDEGALRRALDELVRRHESLRTAFPLVDGLPVQLVSPPGPVELFTSDYSALRDDERDDEAQRLAREHARIPFNLETGPLFRADLARLGERDHLLLLTLHHVIADGWSLDLLWRELAALYNAFTRGQPSPLAQPPVQYGDFAAWQRAWLQGEVLARQLAYWRGALEGAPPLLRLPTDRPRPAVQTHRAAMEAALLPRETADAVLGLARRESATLFMVLLAGLDVVLARLAGAADVVVGTPIAGRTRAETEGVVGLFLNSLALRVDLAGDPSFRELLRRVRESTLGAYAHQDVPFEAVLEEIHPERTLDRTPVFQVMLNLANFAAGAEAGGGAGDLAGLAVHGVDRGGPLASKFDLTLYAGETGSGIPLHLVYNPDLFDAARMRALLAQVAGVLEQAAADPGRPLSALSLAVDEGAPPAAADRAVRTRAGAPAGVGELGEVWTRDEAGEWRRTGQRGRARHDGTVDVIVAEEASPPPAAPAAAPEPPSASRRDRAGGDVGATETERAVLEIWREVLGVGELGPEDDFFDVGGHSLLGVRLLALVKKRLGVTLPLTALFAHPTPAGLAAAVEGAGKAREFNHLVPLGNAEAGTLPPLFCLHAAGGTIFRYRDLAARLGPARMVYALQAGGVSDGREPVRTVDLMAERYLEEVRRVQPHGPYHLAGWSAGGVTAVEMAHRLLAAGEEVGFLGLFDSSPPNADLEIPDPVEMYLRLAAGLTGAEGAVLDALGAALGELPIGARMEHLAGWLAVHGSESQLGELDGLRPVVEVFRANVSAARRHPLAPYPGELTLFCAEWGRGAGWEAAGLPDMWRPYVSGRLRVEVVPGTHVNMVAEPYVGILAEAIEEVITGVPAGVG